MSSAVVVGRGPISSWGKRITALLLLGLALVSWSCSSGSPNSNGPGEIPPPLNQPCDTDVDCGTLKCDPLRGCLPCVFDWHCQKGERCTDDGCKVPVPCKNDDSCKDKPKAPHCDPVLGECVGCRTESDCPSKSHHCIERSCVSYTPCVNSRDCSEGNVCDRALGECVECLGKGDCVKDKEVCVAAHCVPVCTSDKDCAGRNQLCHHDKGYCADCVEQEDCPSIYYCAQDLCKLDVCKPGDRVCQGSTGYGICNAAGSGYDSQLCPISSSCSAANGATAHCEPWLCTPGTSDCSSSGTSVKQCALDGLSIATEIDCAAEGKLCHQAQCKPMVCEPGSIFCQGSELRDCAANGTDSTLRLGCGFGQYCESSTLTCVAQKCTAGSPICDGTRATECNSVGSGPVAGGTDCADDDQACYQGECRDVICDGPFCEDGNAWSCLENGTASKLSNACAASSYCADGLCVVDKCTAGQKVCNVTVATTCKADGSGIEPGGTNCADDGKVCEAGVCVAKVCTPGSYFCADNNPQACNNTGSGSSQANTCPANYFCKPGSATCWADVCSVGQKVCDGNVATTCNAEGSGPAAGGTDCALDGKVCYLGNCLPKICNANEYFCQGGNPYSCGSNGAASTLNDTCLASEFCKPGTSSCLPDVCTAGAATCNGANLSTCAVDGSGPVDAGTSCGSGKICLAGACKAVICTPDALQCSGGNIQRCTDNGTAWSAYQTCSVDTYCNELATPIKCSPDICTPSGSACDGEKLATCATDGGHFSATSTNCASSNTVCTLGNTCAAVALDSLADGSTNSLTSSSLIGNVYRVDRARTLTRIEELLSVTGTSVFTWVVYESTSYTGTFTKLYEGTTSDTGSAAFIGSGAISVPLSVGKYYLLGVLVQGSFTRFLNTSSVRPFVSFGQVWNMVQVSASTPPATLSVPNFSNYYHNQRISTAP